MGSLCQQWVWGQPGFLWALWGWGLVQWGWGVGGKNGASKKPKVLFLRRQRPGLMLLWGRAPPLQFVIIGLMHSLPTHPLQPPPPRVVVLSVPPVCGGEAQGLVPAHTGSRSPGHPFMCAASQGEPPHLRPGVGVGTLHLLFGGAAGGSAAVQAPIGFGGPVGPSLPGGGSCLPPPRGGRGCVRALAPAGLVFLGTRRRPASVGRCVTQPLAFSVTCHPSTAGLSRGGRRPVPHLSPPAAGMFTLS